VEVDKARERRGCTETVYGGGDTQAAGRAGGVWSWATCARSKLRPTRARGRDRRHAASTREGSGQRRVVHVCEGSYDLWQQADGVDGFQI
jgi:hypothetical protein